jgi:hypothetical protein
MRERIITGTVAVLAAVAIAGCNGASTTSSATSGAAASEAPASSTGPSLLVPSLAIPSNLASALPSMALPSPDAALEAMLPNQLCGAEATKSSAAAGSFAQQNTQVQGFLQSIGKTSADVSFAGEVGGTTGCSASIFKINGATATQMHDQFVSAVTQGSGSAPQEKSLGGKTVLATASFGYVSFKDDMMLIFSAPDEAKAGEIAAALP